MPTLRCTTIPMRVLSLALVACGGGNGTDDLRPESPGNWKPDPDRLELKKRIDEILEASGGVRHALPVLQLPDLKPLRPSFRAFGDTVEIVFKAQNAGDADAGAFILRYQVWFIDMQGNNSGPIDGEEQWPGIAAHAEQRSDLFFPQDERFNYDISGFARPIGLAIFVTVDPPDEQNPRGQVEEWNDGINDNDGVYTDDPRNPALPWLIE